MRIRRADAAGWGDALAVIGVVTSMLVCTLAPIGLGLFLFSEHAPQVVCLALMALATCRRRRLGGAAPQRCGRRHIVASVALVATGAVTVAEFSEPWTVLATFAAAATGATDPRRGWRALGWARAATLVAGCAFVSGFLLLYARVMTNHWSTPYLPGPLDPRDQAWLLLGAGVVLVGAACFRVATPAARQMTLLLAAPLTALALGLLGLMPLFDGRIVAYANPSDVERLGIVMASLAAALVTVLAKRRASLAPRI